MVWHKILCGSSRRCHPKMKKVLSSILIGLYLVSTVQLTFDCHFCMGRLVEITFSAPAQLCAGCGMETKKESKDCCKDVQLSLKSGDRHTSPGAYHSAPTPPIFPVNVTTSFIKPTPVVEADIPATHSFHSRPRSLPLYLMLLNYRV